MKFDLPRRIIFQMSDSQYEQLRQLAFERRVHMSEILRTALDEYLDRNATELKRWNNQ